MNDRQVDIFCKKIQIDNLNAIHTVRAEHLERKMFLNIKAEEKGQEKPFSSEEILDRSVQLNQLAMDLLVAKMELKALTGKAKS